MKLNFRAKIVFGVVLIQAVSLTLLVAGGLSWLRESNEKQLLRYATNITHLFATAATDAVISTDLATLDNLIADLADKEDVAYVRVFDRKDRQLASAGGAQPFRVYPTPSASKDGLYHVRVPVMVGEETYGRVELGMEIGSFLALMTDARSMGVFIATMSAITVALFSFLLGSYLSRRLVMLRDAADHISDVGPGVQLEVQGQDELAMLASAFNQMSVSLVQSHERFEHSLDTQRRLALQLDRHQKMLAATISSALDAMITIDRNGLVVEFNESAEQMFGYRRDEIMGKDLAAHIIPESMREAHRQGMAKFRQTGEAPVLGQRMELSALRRDGHQFDCELAIRSVEVGNETLFTAFMRDITERKRAEQELLFAAHAFDANEAIFISDRDGRILRVNKAFCRITGYSEAEVLGQNPRMLSSGLQSDQFYDQLWSQLLEIHSWSGEIVNRRKNGELLPEWLSISSITDANNEITHFVAHFTDLSEQKRVEASLKSARAEAVRASEAKTRFLAAISHEIRTPLNAIINMSQLLKETHLDEEQQRYVESANEAGKTLLALINNVLDFSRIEAGQLKLMPEWFNAADTLGSIVALFEGSASQKQIGLQFNCQIKQALQHYGDPLRLRQIALNLIGNAVKFTEQGTIEVTLSEQSDGIRFSVCDSGIGIAASAQTRLFDEFYQVDEGRNRNYQGTGLGLAITRQLVDLMGGTIGVESQLGSGTCFTVNLPLAVRSTPADIPAARPVPKNVAGFKPRVLLVEDSASNRTVAAAVLKNDVAELVFAENGQQAIALCDEEAFDLILMDMAMPVMDGLEATRRIRAEAGVNQTTPIIAMTANAFEDDKQACFDAGMDDFLSKPLEIDKLRRTLRHWASAVQASAPEEAAPADEIVELPDDEPLIDAAAFESLARDAGVDAMPALVAMIQSETEQRVERMQQAYAEGDAQQLVMEAHTLKSSVGTYGAARLQRLAEQIEAQAKSGQLDEGAALMAQLPDLSHRSMLAMVEHMQSTLE